MKRQRDPILFRHADQDDPQLLEEMYRLHQIFVGGRWGTMMLLWLVIGMVSLWFLRDEFALVRRYFTWAAIRYGLAFNILPTLGLAICVGSTVGLLVWQTRNILWGLPKKEVMRMAQKVTKIREQGVSHPLWRYVCDRPSDQSSVPMPYDEQ